MIKSIQKYAPSLGQCWLILLASFVGQILAGFCLRGFPQSIAYFGSMLVPFALVFLMSLRRPDDSISRINQPKFSAGKCVLLLSFFIVMMACIVVIIDPLISLMPMPQIIKDMFEHVFYGVKPADLIISTCVLAPLCEEFLCRGVMMRGLRQHMSPAAAIVWSAALFGIMHANPWQAVPAFVLGVFFGWVYHRTGCLWLTIVLHSLNNLFSSVMALKYPDSGVDEGFLDMMGPSFWAVFAIAVILLTLLIFFIRKYEKTVSTEVRTDC